MMDDNVTSSAVNQSDEESAGLMDFGDARPQMMRAVLQIASTIQHDQRRMEWLQAAQVALEAGDLEPLRNLTRWKWEPVPIVRFIEDPFFLGLQGQVFPQIMEILEEASKPEYMEVILTGGIGWGKSFAAMLLTAHSLYRGSCLMNPVQEFGLAAGSSIVFVQQSLTKELARKALFDQFARLIRRSPYFSSVCPYDRLLKTELVFAGGLRLEPVAGTETAAIGQNVVFACMDESNFLPVIARSKKRPWTDVYDAAVANYLALSRRMKSRFMKLGKMPGKLLIVSSKRYPDDFTERKIGEAKGDPSIFIADFPQWATKPDGTYLGPRFRVYVPKSQIERPRILQEFEEAPVDSDAEEIIDVPIEYRKEFEADIDDALREIAGRSTQAVHVWLRRRDVLRHAISTDFDISHPFTMQETTLRDGIQVLANRFHRRCRSPRACHIDFGQKHDATGIAIGYVAGERIVTRTCIATTGVTGLEIVDRSQTVIDKVPVYHIEAMLRVVPPPNDEIMFEEVVELLCSIRDQISIPVLWVTTDHFPGPMPLQMLRTRGFRTGVQSVDVDPIPYRELKSALYDERIKFYDYAPVIDELIALETNEKTGRVDHPPWMMTGSGQRVAGRKDVADAVAGVIGILARRPQSFREPMMLEARDGRIEISRVDVVRDD
jgi:hypothetical protein